MLIRFMKWFQGYLYVVIKGYSPERFINLCRNKQILIWELSRVEDGYGFYISVRGFKQLLPIVYKTKTVPYIKKRTGFPFYRYKYRKRKMFFISLFLFSAIIYICSLYVWNIEVTGQFTHTEENIIKFMDSIGTFSGMKKSKIDCQAIEDAIRKEYTDIGWVSAELRGTRLLIKLTETNMPIPKVSVSKNSHIIASRDGIVESIVTRHGTAMVKQGDVVRKGDILISGVIDILNDNKEVIQKQTVIADGDVFLKTYYEYCDEFELKYKDREYTEHSKEMVGFSVFDKNIFFYNILKKFESYEKYDIIVNELSLKVTSNFYLPVKLLHKTYKEYVEIDQVYTKEEAKQKAEKQFARYLERLKESGIEILEHSVKINYTKTKCNASGKIIIIEPQTEYKKVVKSEWRVPEKNELDGKEP